MRVSHLYRIGRPQHSTLRAAFKMFEIFHNETKICTIALAKITSSQDIAPVVAKLLVASEALIGEFRYYYSTTSGSFGKYMGDPLATNPPNWGFSDFDNLEKVLTNFPKPWRVEVSDRPKRDPFVPPDSGAFY